MIALAWFQIAHLRYSGAAADSLHKKLAHGPENYQTHHVVCEAPLLSSSWGQSTNEEPLLNNSLTMLAEMLVAASGLISARQRLATGIKYGNTPVSSKRKLVSATYIQSKALPLSTTLMNVLDVHYSRTALGSEEDCRTRYIEWHLVIASVELCIIGAIMPSETSIEHPKALLRKAYRKGVKFIERGAVA